jgi:hypothetical protein
MLTVAGRKKSHRGAAALPSPLCHDIENTPAHRSPSRAPGSSVPRFMAAARGAPDVSQWVPHRSMERSPLIPARAGWGSTTRLPAQKAAHERGEAQQEDEHRHDQQQHGLEAGLRIRIAHIPSFWGGGAGPCSARATQLGADGHAA